MSDETPKPVSAKPWLFGPGNHSGKEFKPGQSGNPGGKPKRVREALAFALEETPAAFKRVLAMAIDPDEDSRVRHACDKILIAYGIGEPPKTVELKGDKRTDILRELTVEELHALARQSIPDDVPEQDEDAGDDDSDETEH